MTRLRHTDGTVARERRLYTDRESYERDMFYLSQRFEWPMCGTMKQARYALVYPIDPARGVVWC